MEANEFIRRMEEWEANPPTRFDPSALTTCTQVDTCLPGAICTPFGIRSLSPELRTKHIFLTNFWNNNKLLFVGT
jgi:hypothetical protein